MTLDSIWLGVAFSFGFIMKRIGLPPMLGFLGAGFFLNAINMQHGHLLDGLANTGVMLLLFTIGLKLKIKSLGNKVVWGGGLLSTVISIVLFTTLFIFAKVLNVPFFSELSTIQTILIAFALSFSSTVFVIKILEERGNLNSSEGKIAIGILIIQDIIAVIFLTVSKGEIPSPYAFLLLLLPLLRPVLIWILKKSGHGEMLVLFGFFIAILGAEVFELVGLKADLGALVMGIILANHKKTNELARVLLSFKDFFLIAFFLSIGFIGLPDIHTFIIAIILGIILLFKPLIYHFSFTRFSFPVQSSYFASVSLGNYSEFGLIVGVLATKLGWMSADWLIILALAISVSFVISSVLNENSNRIYKLQDRWICAFGTNEVCSKKEIVDIAGSNVLIFGMGRFGIKAYDELSKEFSGKVVAFDSDEQVVEEQKKSNRKVILHDSTDTDFWDSINKDQLKTVVLTMPDYTSNAFAINRLKSTHSAIKIFVTARFDDEAEKLKHEGADYVFNLYEEAGKGFANDIMSKILLVE